MEPTSIAIAYPTLGIELRAYRGLTQPFAAHSHDHYVIGHVEEGARDMICNGETSIVQPSDLLVFNPGAVHECTQHGEISFEYTSLALQPSAVGYKRLEGPIVRDEHAICAFHRLTEALEEGADEAEALSLLDELTSALTARVPNDELDPARTRNGDLSAAAERAQHELRAQTTKRPSLHALANEQGISKYQLLRAYKKRYAITPLAHLSSFKVERARALLAQGIPPNKAAAQAGFADQAHLTRVFKQQIGITPKAYQRMVCDEGVRR